MSTPSNSFDTLLNGARAGDESAVSRLLEAYLKRLESGNPIDRAEFLRKHDQIADRLEPALVNLEFLDRLGRHAVNDRENGLQLDAGPVL